MANYLSLDLIRGLIPTDTWIFNSELKPRYFHVLPPEILIRRWNDYRKKHAGITLEGFKNSHFAQVICRLERAGEIERRWMNSENKGKSVYVVRLTKKGGSHKKFVRKRKLRGCRRSKKKLTLESVQQLRKDWASGGFTYARLAEKYNISTMHAWNCVKGKAWKELNQPVVPNNRLPTEPTEK